MITAYDDPGDDCPFHGPYDGECDKCDHDDYDDDDDW